MTEDEQSLFNRLQVSNLERDLARRELDATKKAKAENDERFMRERDVALQELAALRLILDKPAAMAVRDLIAERDSLRKELFKANAFNDADHYKRYQGSIDQRMRLGKKLEEERTKSAAILRRLEELVHDCEWYADKGTSQELHHFLKIEARANFLEKKS